MIPNDSKKADWKSNPQRIKKSEALAFLERLKIQMHHDKMNHKDLKDTLKNLKNNYSFNNSWFQFHYHDDNKNNGKNNNKFDI